MALPAATDVDWSDSTIQVEARLVRQLLPAFSAFILAAEFDEQDNQDATFDPIFLHLFHYYDHITSRLLWEHLDRRQEVVDTVNILLAEVDQDSFVAKYPLLLKSAKRSTLAQSRLFACLLWMHYTAAQTLCAPLYLWPQQLGPSMRRSVRFKAADFIAGLAESVRYAKTDVQILLGSLLLESITRTFARALGETAVLVDEEDLVFSRLETGDLDALAQRDLIRVAHYSQSIEAALEDQLDLLFRSFGFSVVRARPGEAKVDLVCLGTAPDAFTFLVEAKSSARPYGLPMDDRRAAESYINNVKRSKMNPFANVDFFLLVVGRPANVLAVRMRELERAVGIACRYVTAASLAWVRESVGGPVDADTFRGVVRSGDGELTRSDLRKVVEATRAYETLQVSLRGLLERSMP